MIKKLFKLNRTYRDAKEQVVEQSVRVLEAKTKPLFFSLFLALAVVGWLVTASTNLGPVEIYEAYGFVPVIAVFAVSYFCFFLGSKIVVKPTAEELEDDTSSFALFSACGRRELRSLMSVGFASLHTFIFFLYLISKDPKLLEALGIAVA